MIKIYKDNLDEIAKKYFQHIRKYMEKSSTKYDFNKTNEEIKAYFNVDFKTIVTSRPQRLREFISIFNAKCSTLNKNTCFKPYIKNNSMIVLLKDLYGVFRKKYGVDVLSDLNLKVCPYCNREYIFKFSESEVESRIIASLDHYYDKDTFPFLAVSFFNIIPSCNICNSKFKHTKDFYFERHLHPYEDDFNLETKFVYSFNNEVVDSVLSEKKLDISIKIKNINNNILTNNTIKTFRIKQIYNEHKDIIVELLQKKEMYNESYIDELFKQYEGKLFKNREDLLRLVTCGYLTNEDLGKRPLSKLIKDISEQLELI